MFNKVLAHSLQPDARILPLLGHYHLITIFLIHYPFILPGHYIFSDGLVSES